MRNQVYDRKKVQYLLDAMKRYIAIKTVDIVAAENMSGKNAIRSELKIGAPPAI